MNIFADKFASLCFSWKSALNAQGIYIFPAGRYISYMTANRTVNCTWMISNLLVFSENVICCSKSKLTSIKENSENSINLGAKSLREKNLFTSHNTEQKACSLYTKQYVCLMYLIYRPLSTGRQAMCWGSVPVVKDVIHLILVLWLLPM